ncbi:hypothetical protein ACEU2D_12500 [Brevibacillus laterosporus]|uniref:hypothetical protein n=1 Tax=Brevibacillus laterosporus TaxID=1465 RepID=UPI0035A5C7C9
MGGLCHGNGPDLASNGDIVVVTVNYRLEALGNLFLPGISEGNLCIKGFDSCLALGKE